MRVIASQKLSREQWRDNFCPARHQDLSQGPLGARMPPIEGSAVPSSKARPNNQPIRTSMYENPGHLRPVILKPVGRIFEISDSKPIQGKCGKCGKSLSPQKNKGLRRFRRAKNERKTRKVRTRKRGKCGKCG